MQNWQKGGLFLIYSAILVWIGMIAEGHILTKPGPTPVAMAAIVQPDKSVLPPVAPGADKQADKMAKAPMLPKGATHEHTVIASIQPEAQPAPPPIAPFKPSSDGMCHDTPEPAPVCKAVTVRLDAIKTADGYHRYIVSTPDGTILNTLDVPPEKAPLVFSEPKYGIGPLAVAGLKPGVVATYKAGTAVEVVGEAFNLGGKGGAYFGAGVIWRF